MMVWGMDFPSSFGDYWPLGDYEGWDEALIEYFDSKMSDEEKAPFLERGPVRYHRFVSQKFQREIGVKYIDPSLPDLTPIKPHEPPQVFKAEKSYKNLGSLMALNDGLLAVDETLKVIIERLEPGVHQFFPIKILMPRGKNYPIQYYILVIGQYFDSFSSEDSHEGSWERSELGYIRYEDNKAGISGLAFQKTVFGTAHLWRESKISGMITCFSDKLQGAISEAGLRMPKKFYRMKEV